MDTPQTIHQLVCVHCGHTWYPRSPELPQICPKGKHDWRTPAKAVGRPRQAQREGHEKKS